MEGRSTLPKGLGHTFTAVSPATLIKHTYSNAKLLIRGNMNKGRARAWVHLLCGRLKGCDCRYSYKFKVGGHNSPATSTDAVKSLSARKLESRYRFCT